MALPNRLFLALICLGFLSSCANPYERELPTDLEDKDALKAFQSKLDGLSEQEKKDVASYILRMKMGESFGKALGMEETDGIPPGMTVGRAIKEQRSFQERERKKKENLEEEGKKKEKINRNADGGLKNQ